MKTPKIIGALGRVKENLVARAAEYTPDDRPRLIKKLVLLVLGLCAAVALGLFVAQMLQPVIPRVQQTEDGVRVGIPSLLLGDTAEGYGAAEGVISGDAAVGFIYYDNAYYEASVSIPLPRELVGERVGTLNRSPGSDAGTEGVIPYEGVGDWDIHTVKGYAPSFMLCAPDVGTVYVRAGGYGVKYGREIFVEELHLPGDYTEARVGLKEPRYFQDYGGSIYSQAMAESLLKEVCAAEFLPTEGNAGELLGYLHFVRTDGTTTTLCLYEGGYLSYLEMDEICVRISDGAFQTAARYFSSEDCIVYLHDV